MKIEDIIKTIAPKDSWEFHCYDTLRHLLETNKNFYDLVVSGLNNGTIRGFGDELWEKLDSQNMRAKGVNSFLEVLRDGYNQGYCTVASKQVSYSMDNCFICGGTLPILAGTANCKDGSHTWISKDNTIYDTTLMLVIDESLIENFGYNEENRYDPNIDPIYCASKEFTNDTNLRR